MSNLDKQSIPGHLHQKMKILAKQRGQPIIREYELAIEIWIANQNQEILLADSKLEKLVMEKLHKTEERLAALTARVGMDTSIVLMGVLLDMSKNHDISENDLYYQLRKAASKYFSRSLKHVDELDASISR